MICDHSCHLPYSLSWQYNPLQTTQKEMRMITLEWLGTAGFRIASGPAAFLIDPFVSRNRRARPLQSLCPEDLRGDHPIFITHGHFDHISDVPEIVRGTSAVVYGSLTALAPARHAGVPDSQLHAVTPDQTIELAGFRATALASRHIIFDLPQIWRMMRQIGWRAPRVMALARRYPAGQVLSWRFEIGGQTIHHLGSGGSTKDELHLLAGSRPDVLLPPLQGHSHIHGVALRYVECMQPRVVIPHHQDDFYPPISQMVSLEPFLQAMRERYPHVQVIEPAIGQPITL